MISWRGLTRADKSLTRSAMTNRLLTIGQVASRLRVSDRTIYRLIASGELRIVKVRGATRIHPAQVSAYLRRAGKAP